MPAPSRNGSRSLSAWNSWYISSSFDLSPPLAVVVPAPAAAPVAEEGEDGATTAAGAGGAMVDSGAAGALVSGGGIAGGGMGVIDGVIDGVFEGVFEGMTGGASGPGAATPPS